MNIQKKANELRKQVIMMLAQAGSGHPGGSLGTADIFATLYFGNVMKYDAKKPTWEKRDYLVLSNGHICPILYAAMAEAGFFSKKALLTLRQLGSKIQGHPHRTALPGLETSSGPLGEGISQAAGMALGLRMDKKKNRVICICSDGEQNEGNTWEGAQFAAKYKLHNLLCIMDRNKIQLSGDTKDIMPLGDFVEKYKAFGWDAEAVDGHNVKQLIAKIKKKRTKPTMLVAHTLPGKGVSFMEGKWEWHGKTPTEEEASKALAELQ